VEKTPTGFSVRTQGLTKKSQGGKGKRRGGHKGRRWGLETTEAQHLGLSRGGEGEGNGRQRGKVGGGGSNRANLKKPGRSNGLGYVGMFVH